MTVTAIHLCRWLIHRRWSDAGRLRKDLNRVTGMDLDDDVHAYFGSHYQQPECRDSVVAHIRDGSPTVPVDRFADIRVIEK